MQSYMQLLYYKKNDHIIREDDKLNYLLFLVKGKAKAYHTLSNGKSLLICFYQGFQVLGELELLNKKKASTNIQVIEDSCCIGIPYKDVYRYLLDDPKFLRYICNTLGDKLHKHSMNSSINILYSLEYRLVSYIRTAGERVEEAGSTKIIWNENLTHTADLLGTSYRHLLRTLQILGLKGVIKKSENGYEVDDEGKLIDISAELFQ
jgi:CRP-like cAMP-binding protein